MAKKRKGFFKKARSYAGKVYKKGKRGISRMNSGLDLFDPLPVIYGAARPMIASKVPAIPMLGVYSDNIVLGGTALAIGTFVKNPLVRKVCKEVIHDEKFLIGNDLNAQFMGGSQSSSSNLDW